jgi:drug/metabolite transporter (DMT)-like permease
MKWALVLLIIACNTVGDLTNAYGMRLNGEVTDFHPAGIRRLLASIVRNGFVVGGIAAMAVAFFALLALLSVADLSFAIPATSGSYVLETVLAKFLLKEDVRWQRWMGACMVACGVGLLWLD